MDRFNALGRGMQLMLVAGVLLLIDSFFRWQEVSAEFGGVEVSAGESAWGNIGGILMALLTIVLIAWIGARLAGVDIPLPVSPALISAVLAGLIFLLALLKNLIDDYSTFWSYVGIVLAALIAVGAWLQIQAGGGMEALKSEIPSMGSAGAATSAPPPQAPPATAPPPPAAPPESAPEEEPPPERQT